MKKRQGFVSNSSSSSFVLVGKAINLKTLEDFKNEQREGTCISAEGKDLCDAMDFFTVSEEHFEAMLEFKILDEFTFYREYASGEYKASVPEKLEPECIAVAIDMDYHTSETVEDMIENYETEIAEAKKTVINSDNDCNQK